MPSSTFTGPPAPGSPALAVAPPLAGARRHDRRTWVQWLGELPGLLADTLSRRPEPVPAAPITLEALAERAAASPRANGYLSLEPELRAFGTRDGLLTWASHRRTAFAVGGLHAVGDPTRLARSFVSRLATAGFRRVLLFPVAAAEREVIAAAGMRSLMVGAEAFLAPADWSLGGKRRADLRQMVNRGRKRYGVTVQELEPDPARHLTGGIYDRWLGARPAGHRMRLLVGTPSFDRPAARRYFVASRGGDLDTPVALCTVTPGWGGAGHGVDVMARLPGAPAGAMEVLLTDIAQRLFDEGCQRFSLGASPMLERTPIAPPDSRLLRAAFRWLFRSRLGNRLFRFRSLAHFKQKFAPTWEPVHIGAWPRVGVTALYAACRMWGLFGPRRLD